MKEEAKLKMYPKIKKFIEEIEIRNIPNERKEILDLFISFISKELKQNKPVNINFICTHNSRRSQLGQIWAQTMAIFYGFKQINSYSGGTEETSTYRSVIDVLSAVGFEIIPLSEGTNPIFAIKVEKSSFPILCFSKTFDHMYNPQSDFVAVMTCDSADEKCPIVSGAKARFPIKYSDPKISDGSASEIAVYKERSLQIAQEMKYVFSRLDSEFANKQ